MKKRSLKRWYYVSIFLFLIVFPIACSFSDYRFHAIYVAAILGTIWVLVFEGVGGWSPKKILGYPCIFLPLIAWSLWDSSGYGGYGPGVFVILAFYIGLYALK